MSAASTLPFAVGRVKSTMYLNWVNSAIGPAGRVPGDVVVGASSAMGWTWGAEWTTPKDIQHFSATGD